MIKEQHMCLQMLFYTDEFLVLPHFFFPQPGNIYDLGAKEIKHKSDCWCLCKSHLRVSTQCGGNIKFCSD